MGSARVANTSGDRPALLGVVYTAVLYSTTQQRQVISTEREGDTSN